MTIDVIITTTESMKNPLLKYITNFGDTLIHRITGENVEDTNYILMVVCNYMEDQNTFSPEALTNIVTYLS